MKERKTVKLFDIILYVLFGILALITIYPFYNVFIVSFSNTKASVEHSPYILPYVFDLEGYKAIMNDIFFFKSLLVTIFVTVVGGTLNMVFSIIAAYVLSRRGLIGRKFLLSLILFTMFFSGGMIPTYLVISDFKLVDNVFSMILPTMLNTYYVIIMKNYFASLPIGLSEAASIDGANALTILLRIYLPISKPFMATFALFYAVERWNGWWSAFLYISNKNIKPLQIYLREVLVNFNTQLATQAQSMLTQEKIFIQSVQMAAIVVTMLPILCLYPFLQKYFVSGIMIGSIKE
ncbi:MAG: carbohydrate ABC transporter permease [Catonella sp.]|uniref:carbohydrate ABC transporter permease n=1 Tax=Catonella sp. TaxID=2382125 RepID=UPI003FA0F6E8